ncbi:Tat pathway signal sequence domain protein [Streptomyces sp. HUAS MG47]|uniref:Tat pathway signal sequence domain protein n=1 Tax=Streptomyces solicamelliae TaxID=3231716 RepID=UPI0038784279
MYEKVRRHLGKVVAGTALAVTATAAMVAVTLPGPAGADESPKGLAGGAAQPEQQGETAAQGAPAPGTVASVPPAGAKGVGTDPLTDDELKRAEALALTPPARAAYRNVDGARGPQHLATVLAEPPAAEADAPAPPRRAEVRYYDYKSDALVTRTVNLDTGTVEGARALRGVQPSAHPRELREALELILASPLGTGVKEDYRDATGKVLASPDQLWFNGDVYRTYREANVPAALEKCGEHRCVRLVTKIRNGSWIDTRNLIVDLSARTVTRVG